MDLAPIYACLALSRHGGLVTGIVNKTHVYIYVYICPSAKQAWRKRKILDVAFLWADLSTRLQCIFFHCIRWEGTRATWQGVESILSPFIEPFPNRWRGLCASVEGAHGAGVLLLY